MSNIQKISKYLVLKKMKYNGRKYYPGNIVLLPSHHAEMFFFAGVITDDRKIVKGKVRHPLDKRFFP
jgi:hypothetical protein